MTAARRLGYTERLTRPSSTQDHSRLLEKVRGLERKHDRTDVGVHSTRVSFEAGELCDRIGMDPESKSIVMLAARCHDVGKVWISDATLNHDGPLDQAMRAEIETHARSSLAILKRVPGVPDDVLSVAVYHHEEYDGGGYEGLRGEEIPLAARVVQICDVFDAVASPRAYKKGQSRAATLAAMTSDDARFGRRMFDPLLLRGFVAAKLEKGVDGLDPATERELRNYVDSDPLADVAPDQVAALRERMDAIGFDAGTFAAARRHDPAPEPLTLARP